MPHIYKFRQQSPKIFLYGHHLLRANSGYFHKFTEKPSALSPMKGNKFRIFVGSATAKNFILIMRKYKSVILELTYLLSA